ncbi:MAG: DUF2721 domain-containing protein [Cytophagales bacterium]|nr:DUF2721 domain-containing protein [Cytophagales bacterium]
MNIDLTTPALLFPAISLLLLAYTNRFLTLASLIRSLHDKYLATPDEQIIVQIKNLKLRVTLIKQMQAAGIASLFLCVLCMFILFWGKVFLGQLVFGASLVLMMVSLALSFREIQISINALNIQLSDIEHFKDAPKRNL